MRLYRWQGACRNFGDELNTLLWPRLLPSFFDDQPGARFLGIGSVLDERHPPHELKIVAGAGFGGYEKPARLDDTWRIQWVRGPRTAEIYGLPGELALGDPASLLPHAFNIAPAQRGVTGFMPHFESAGWGNWTEVAAMAGVQLIDPRGEPAAIIRQIAGCRVLISEALHGVITADALRVPWIAIRPRHAVHRAKWRDWADSISLRLDPRRLRPSSLLEQATTTSPLTGWRLARRTLDRHADHLRRFEAARFIAHAAAGLGALASDAPQLSTEAALDRCQTRMMERVRILSRGAPYPPTPVGASRAGAWRDRIMPLRPFSDSAYHLR